MDGASFSRLSASDLPAFKVSQLRVGQDGGGGVVRSGVDGERMIRGLRTEPDERRELHGNREGCGERTVLKRLCAFNLRVGYRLMLCVGRAGELKAGSQSFFDAGTSQNHQTFCII